MESYFLGETLKYLYLLNDPESDVDLKKVCFFHVFGFFLSFSFSHFACVWKHIFNTKGHPLRDFIHLPGIDDNERGHLRIGRNVF